MQYLGNNQMQKSNGTSKEEGQIHSLFDETINSLNYRTQFFPLNHISNQTQLLKAVNTPPVKTIANILPVLCLYSVGDSPLQPQVRDLYTSQYDSPPLRCVLPPPSDGERSVNLDDDIPEPTFKWLSSALIDSTRVEVDQIEPRKVEKGKIPQEWANITELMVYNIDKKIYIRQVAKELEKCFHAMFTKFPWVRIKRMKFIYFRGKASAILRFSDSTGLIFAYYNMIISNQIQRKQQLGQNSQIFRILNNRLKLEQHDRWVGILFRKLPHSLLKDAFLSTLKKKNLNPIWVEELVQIQNHKFTLCTVSSLQEAFRFCQAFQVNSPFKEVKVNLHPKSKKIWSPSSPELLT